MFIKLLSSLFLLIAFTAPLYSQSGNLKLNRIGLEQGLSQSSIYSIVQDTLGFIWLGTQDGLNRYDGYSVKVYKNIPADSNSITFFIFKEL